MRENMGRSHVSCPSAVLVLVLVVALALLGRLVHWSRKGVSQKSKLQLQGPVDAGKEEGLTALCALSDRHIPALQARPAHARIDLVLELLARPILRLLLEQSPLVAPAAPARVVLLAELVADLAGGRAQCGCLSALLST